MMKNYPKEAYVIDGTYCEDRASAITQAAACARCSVKGMFDTGLSESFARDLLAEANKTPLTEVKLAVDGNAFGKGSNPEGYLQGEVRAMRVRWSTFASSPAPTDREDSIN